MDIQKATVLVMAHMALADGGISPEESDFLTPFLEPGVSLEELLKEAQAHSLQELLEPIESYADRFFIALRAASMAHVDSQLDAQEEDLYERLVKLLEISPADQEVIARAVAAFLAEEAEEPEARVAELFAQSSFC